jgi:lipopolysaccharide/colanic/teichoic acid biosynthesis glycosyltransferase
MSLVGPRPLLLRYNERYSHVQARRLQVKPGLTGWAQVNGRNDTTWFERLDRDVWYVENLSPVLDLKILLKTIPTVLLGVGVSPAEDEFMPEFAGEGSEAPTNDSMAP